MSTHLGFESVNPDVGKILGRVLEGEEISWREALRLCQANGIDFHAVVLAADEMRRRQAGDVVTYVVNRNINFTNVCTKHCGFCAFSRTYSNEEGYFLPIEEIVRRTLEAVELGATEVCLQAGLPPGMDGELYIDITRAVRQAAPGVHIHAFSPEEVLYGCLRSGASIPDYLRALKNAGLNSIPGTSAEILDQDIRDRISPGRITVRQWIEVITTAHDLGIPTTSTIMYGHVETPEHWVKHMNLLRDIQHETGGFTEFVPLSLVYQEAPMYQHQLAGIRQGATGVEVIKMHAVARLMLGPLIRNIQASWVKEGPKLSQQLLTAGANDLGGTLINESISTSAGAQYGQLVQPQELRRWIHDLGRIPAQRRTNYELLRTFDVGDQQETLPLDLIENSEERFGSYRKLAASSEFRFRKRQTTIDQ
jgi:FO synthase subunit 2